MGFFRTLPVFKRHDLRFRQNHTLLRHLRLERFQALAHGLQVMAHPDHAHAGGRQGNSELGQLVRHAELSPRRLIHRHLHACLLDMRLHAILVIGFAATDFVEGRLTAALVEFFESIEAIATVTHQATGVRHVSELFGEFQQPHFRLDHFLCCRHRLGSFRATQNSNRLSD